MPDLHRSPAHVTAEGASRLPRRYLLGLLALFILVGLFGRDLWPEDAVGFGRMWTVAHGDAADWLLPNVAGAIAPIGGGPLPYWVGAAFIALLGPWIGDTNAAAAANLFWVPVILAAIWLAIFRFARRDEAQPVAGAFGGEASRLAYARLCADIGVLLTIGTLGVAWRFHQTSVDNASLTCGAAAMLALSLLEWRLLYAALIAGAACAAYALTQGPMGAAGLLLGCFAALVMSQRALKAPPVRLWLGVGVMVTTAVAIPLAWGWMAWQAAPGQAEPYFEAWRTTSLVGPDISLDLSWLLRDGSWFFWPLWPLAFWALYAWRGSLAQVHVLRPVCMLLGLLLGALLSGALHEYRLVACLAPLVVLAAFGATCLRRAMDNIIDWMAIALFSLAQFVLWAYYLAWITGTPKAMFTSVARLTPGFVEHPKIGLLMVAALSTIAWVLLILWRVRKRPAVLWRGPLLAAAGITAVWIQANLLYLPALNHVFSYRPFATDIASQLRARNLLSQCVLAQQVPPFERAVLAYDGGIRFQREGRNETCRVAITHDIHRSSLDDIAPPGVLGSWTLVWETRRRQRPEEHWQIWVRKP